MVRTLSSWTVYVYLYCQAVCLTFTVPKTSTATLAWLAIDIRFATGMFLRRVERCVQRNRSCIVTRVPAYSYRAPESALDTAHHLGQLHMRASGEQEQQGIRRKRNIVNETFCWVSAVQGDSFSVDKSLLSPDESHRPGIPASSTSTLAPCIKSTRGATTYRTRCNR